MRLASIYVTLAALCLVDSNRPPSGVTEAASFEKTPCPQPNIAGFPTSTSRQVFGVATSPCSRTGPSPTGAVSASS